MAYFEDEIPKELEEGKEYTNRELAGLLSFNTGIVVLCSDTPEFYHSDEETKYKVVEKIQAYIHECKDGAYHLPFRKKTIYRVKRV